MPWLIFQSGYLFFCCWVLIVLWIFWIKVLYQISFAHIFFQSVLVFSLSWHSFLAKQKCLIQYNLAHQLFISCIMTLALYLKSHCCTHDHVGFLFMPTILIVLNFKCLLINLSDIYRVFHPKTMNFTFFSRAHRTSSRIDHILGHKSSLGKLKKNWNHSKHLFWPQCSKIRSQLQEKNY